MECAPVWDGEDDLSDQHSLDDPRLLPNLRLFTGGRPLKDMIPGALDILAARGVATRVWVRNGSARPGAPHP